MGDSTSCGIFGELFAFAENEIESPSDRRALVEKLYEMSHEYDFSICECDSDDILSLYDLVRIYYDERYEEWTTVYRGEDGFEDASPYNKDYYTWVSRDGPTIVTVEDDDGWL